MKPKACGGVSRHRSLVFHFRNDTRKAPFSRKEVPGDVLSADGFIHGRKKPPGVTVVSESGPREHLCRSHAHGAEGQSSPPRGPGPQGSEAPAPHTPGRKTRRPAKDVGTRSTALDLGDNGLQSPEEENVRPVART